MELSRSEYMEAIRLYWAVVNTLPVDLQEACPNSDTFLDTDGWIFSKPQNWKSPDARNFVMLNDRGAANYRMLRSPHAKTLMRVYALNRVWSNGRS